jgi:hypothetical protein
MTKGFPIRLLLFLVASAGSCAAQQEILSFSLTGDWRQTYGHQERGHVTREYLRSGEDPTHWTERFVYQNGPLRGKLTPEEEFNKLKADEEKRCPGAMQWSLISQDEHSILFESQSTHCQNDADKHIIYRILHGKHNFFALFYVATGDDLPPDRRTKWIGVLGDASIGHADKDEKAVAPLDVDSVIPAALDKVMAALKPAMQSADCDVKEETATRVECKRPRNSSGEGGDYGGESVTAVLEAQGSQTRIRITTGKGFVGRLGKKNWSVFVYETTLKNLQTAQ